MDSAGFVSEDGKPVRTPYALRHSYITWSLKAGIPTFTVAERAGTSLQMIEKTYGHLARDTEAWEITRLSGFISGRTVDAEEATQ